MSQQHQQKVCCGCGGACPPECLSCPFQIRIHIAGFVARCAASGNLYTFDCSFLTERPTFGGSATCIWNAPGFTPGPQYFCGSAGFPNMRISGTINCNPAGTQRWQIGILMAGTGGGCTFNSFNPGPSLLFEIPADLCPPLDTSIPFVSANAGNGEIVSIPSSITLTLP